MIEKKFEDIEVSADLGWIRLYTSDEDYEDYDGDEVLDMLNNQHETITELKTIKNKYKGQRDYLLFVIERCCTKEKFEETKSYLQDVEDNYG